jgi:hypothetical protein
MNVNAINTDCNATVHAITMDARAPGAGVLNNAEDLTDSIPADNQLPFGVWNSPTRLQPVYPYTLFNKSPLQLRRIGARGGKAHGRNQRMRRALLPTPPASVPIRAAPRQSTAEAAAVLDAQFPWLRCAEQRRSRNPKCTRRTRAVAANYR